MSHVKELASNFEQATFAGGCFWCIESAFAQIPGVIQTISGLTGGASDPGSYEAVHEHPQGHVEAVQLTYDPSQISYEDLLNLFWRQIDPTDAEGQFVDRGPLYTTAIFYHNESQKHQALESKTQLEKSGLFTKPIVTQILPARKFYQAEDYHQGYYTKYPERYRIYRAGSGRNQFITAHWK